MATGTLVSPEEYLSTSYRPDCDYVDGVVLERNLGEQDHSRLQMALAAFLFNRERQWAIHVFPEQRVQVSRTRFRVPDICVVCGPRPVEQIFTTPPFICIEILSKDDTMTQMQERIDDYLNFGVGHVWLIDPRTRRAYDFTGEGMREAKDRILRTQNPEIIVPLAELFG
jgi:Uma2 family endonuclease